MGFKMVNVFNTTVQQVKESKKLVKKLSIQFPDCKINFDLSDCDNLFRIEGTGIHSNEIIRLLQKNNDQYEILI
jgi:hypothetical protein